MLKDKFSIDNLFLKGLKDYEQTPDSRVWSAISYKLEVGGRRDKEMTLWLIVASVALIVSIVTGYLLIDRDRFLQQPLLVDYMTEGPVQRFNSMEKIAMCEKEGTRMSPRQFSDESVLPPKKYNSNQKNRFKSIDHKKGTVRWLPNFIADRLSDLIPVGELDMELQKVEFKKSDYHQKLQSCSTQMRLAAKDDLSASPMKLSIIGQVSSVYASAFSSSNSASLASPGTLLYDNIESGVWSKGGGIKVNVQTSSKICFQTGVYYNRIGQTFIKSEIFNSELNVRLDPMETRGDNTILTSAGFVKLNKEYQTQFLNPGQFTDIGSQDIVQIPKRTSLTQLFETVEVPLLVSYSLIDKRIGVNFLGGLSTSWIVGNKVYFNDGDQNQCIGYTANIQTANFSSRLAIDLEYKITPSINICIEPCFNYYLNSLSSDKRFSYRPYLLGFNTGFRFIF